MLQPSNPPSLAPSPEPLSPSGPATPLVPADVWHVTGRSLPSPPGDAYPLVSQDFVEAARQLGVEAAAIHAVAVVESGGRTGFDYKKRPTIRYENHKFRALTHHAFDKSDPDLSNAYKSSGYHRTHRFGGDRYADEQWDLLERAFDLAPDAAIKACSWGMFQVMGSNYHLGGWTALDQFVKDMFHSAGQHLRAFLGYCRANHLVPYLARREWAGFALRYNGGDYRTIRYDAKLASAYAQYQRAGD